MTDKPKNKKKTTKKKPKKITYVHLDEYLAIKPGLPPHIIEGFKIYMRGKTYQHSVEDFDRELDNFYNRKV